MANPGYLTDRDYVSSALAASGLGKQNWTPSDYGLLTWTDDPCRAAGNSLLGTAGTITGVRFYLPVAAALSKVWTNVITVGSGLTTGQNFGAWWDSSGNLLEQSNDQTTNWTATSDKSFNFTSTTVRPAGFYDFGMWFNGTTSPALMRGSAVSAINLGLTGQAIRFWTANTGVTTTAPATLGTKTARSVAWQLEFA